MTSCSSGMFSAILVAKGNFLAKEVIVDSRQRQHLVAGGVAKVNRFLNHLVHPRWKTFRSKDFFMMFYGWNLLEYR